MNYTIAETRNVQDDTRVTIHANGSKYYLEFEDSNGDCVLSREGGREMFDLFYEISRYVVEGLYSAEYKADMVRNA